MNPIKLAAVTGHMIIKTNIYPLRHKIEPSIEPTNTHIATEAVGCHAHRRAALGTRTHTDTRR